MSEKPVLFSGPMVRAILEGRKTQTRRAVQSPAKNMQRAGMQVIKRRAPGDPWYDDHVWSMRGRTGVWGDYTDEKFRGLCPYGAPGDRLYVRERFAPFTADGCSRVQCSPRDAAYVVFTDGSQKYRDGSIVRPLAKYAPGAFDGIRWSPSIHMPRWASRITLEVTEVRVQRLQEITEEDAIAEGIERGKDFFGCPMWRDYSTPDSEPAWYADDPVTSFRTLWESINGARPGCSWDDDPWVWVVEFRRITT